MYEADKHKFRVVFHMSRNATPPCEWVKIFQKITIKFFTGTFPASQAYNLFSLTGIYFGFGTWEVMKCFMGIFFSFRVFRKFPLIIFTVAFLPLSTRQFFSLLTKKTVSSWANFDALCEYSITFGNV